MKKRLRIPGPLVGLVLFTAALWIIRRQLHTYHYRDILAGLEGINSGSLAAALLLAAINYLVLTGYDTLAFRYIRRPTPYRATALTSFISTALSMNIGLSWVTGGSVRYRFYSAMGVAATGITSIVGFIFLTSWLGMFTAAGVAFVAEPPGLPAVLNLHLIPLRLLGLLFLLLVSAYMLLGVFRRRPLRFLQWDIPVPSSGVSLLQILLATTDWTLAAAVLYALMPPAGLPPFHQFLGIFLLAQLSGLSSQVPGGLGVFETVMITLLQGIPSATVLGVLLAFRGLYYLLPLVLAVMLLAIREILPGLRLAGARVGRIGTLLPALAPDLISLLTFFCGVVLLFSGATPAAAGRLALLERFLPVPLMELSHFLGSLTGLILLVLAWGLHRRLEAAYHMTLTFLGAGAVFSMAKALDWEEALILSAQALAIFSARRHFRRPGSLWEAPFTPGWSAALGLAVVSSFWLGMFVYRHVEYTNQLWWSFTLHGEAPRFLRASLGLAAAGLTAAVYLLLKPSPPSPAMPTAGELEQAGEVIRASPRTYANLAFLGDKYLLFSPSRRSFIMYGLQGRSQVAMGDPVGPADEAEDLAWTFHEECDRHDAATVFYEVSPAYLPIYLDLGLSLIKLGEEAQVPLRNFSLEGAAMKGFRHTVNRLERDGLSFRLIPAEEIPSLMSGLRAVSDAWLADKHTREKRFSLGFFDEGYLRRFPAGVVTRDAALLAFANLWTGAGGVELSVDLMRYAPEAPHGVMDYLFIKLMLWGQAQGYARFNLGMAPLAGMHASRLAGPWQRLAGQIFKHGEHFYHFRGLRDYKAKFGPSWEPRYLAAPGGLALPRVLLNLTGLVSGGYRGVAERQPGASSRTG